MNDLLQESATAFLRDVEGRVPAELKHVEFESILSELIRWSAQTGLSLTAREPGVQNTVSFGLAATDFVLWAAYPRHEDGAKIVVLPRIFRRLPEVDQLALLESLKVVAPGVSVEGTGVLQIPMHLLATNRALGEFKNFLNRATSAARRHPALAESLKPA